MPDDLALLCQLPSILSRCFLVLPWFELLLFFFSLIAMPRCCQQNFSREICNQLSVEQWFRGRCEPRTPVPRHASSPLSSKADIVYVDSQPYAVGSAVVW